MEIIDHAARELTMASEEEAEETHRPLINSKEIY